MELIIATARDFERRACLAALLAQPDPPDLPPRRHHLCFEGRPGRHAELTVAYMMAYAQWRYVDLHEDARGRALWVC